MAAAGQVLLAIASGAWLLDPSYVQASLQAGAWLPEAPYAAKVQGLSPRTMVFLRVEAETLGSWPNDIELVILRDMSL